MILLIDNYDSFTYNLVQYFGELEQEVKVFRNDALGIGDVREMHPDHIVVSPGPCTPNEAGISVELIRELGSSYPILGVCLGHQSIGQAYGGDIVRADRIMHGKTCEIHHHGDELFRDIPSPFIATRYHSLIIKRATCPESLEIIAETDQQEIMAVKHREHPVWGVQFHPESILTEVGKLLLKNFIDLGQGFAAKA